MRPLPDENIGYPRPQLVRSGAVTLDGLWDFAFDPDARWCTPDQVRWETKILVPFSPETEASGIGNTGFFRACWYRTTFDPPPLHDGERLLLHFGAVDYDATVFVNGIAAGGHEGGYTPFTIDLAPHTKGTAPLEIVVRAEDDPLDLAKPRGKQDWKLEPHSIWYPRTTGIWQTVWVEKVPKTWLQLARWTPNLERWEVALKVWIGGERIDGSSLSVTMRAGDLVVADDSYKILGNELQRRVSFTDPGIDDYRNELLWSPATPTLIDVDIQIWAGRGDLIDSVKSYTAMRSVAIQGDRFVLNGRPYPLRLVLDQGYWPESGITAPDDRALRRDVELAKEMGFNGVRKHQKIEAPRYLYWADRLGLLVWEEMPSAYRFTQRSIRRLTAEWKEALQRDYSHPCIVSWVPFNESWGVPNLPDNPSERHYVQALYHLTKTIDTTRPVIGNDGWESVATDIIGIHDYDDDPERISRRYQAEETLPRLFRRERPGGRLLILEGHEDQPIVLSEFGGIAFSDRKGSWGYSRAASSREFAQRYTELLGVVRTLGVLAGFCYTQFADTYQESNGLLYDDRTPKFPIEQIAEATRGIRTLPPAPMEEPHEQQPQEVETTVRDAAPGGPLEDLREEPAVKDG